jgi:ATP-dependent RNA helicase RhlE
MSFTNLGLSSSLLKAIKEQNYEKPYPIQEQAIPAILSGKHIFGIAKTGSGKTAGFVLPILQMLQGRKSRKNRHVSVLVLVPTRELATQVAEVFKVLGAHLPERIKTLAVYGGVSINPQMMAMKDTDVLVATPGRLLDLVDNNAVKLGEVEILVLDEADKMVNMGFEEEMNRIISLLPTKRQNLLFSATLGDAIEEIRKKILSDPLVIEIEEEKKNIDLIHQVAYTVAEDKKNALLRYLIKTQEMEQVLVFVSSSYKADHLTTKLVKNKIDAVAMHGKKSQGARTEALSRFKSGKVRVLVATDLISRGIDIQLLPYVINYELPRSPSDYVHRIGRTGRAESPGNAITLLSPSDEHHFKVIQKKTGKQVEMRDAGELNLHGY